MAEKDLDKGEFWKEMFILFDKEDKGYLTLEELKKYLQAVGVLITNKELYKKLEEFDPDKNGKISKEELKYVMTNLGDTIKDEDAEKLLSNFKVDDQGYLDYKEFLGKYGINC